MPAPQRRARLALLEAAAALDALGLQASEAPEARPGRPRTAAHAGKPADHFDSGVRCARHRLQQQRIFQRLIPQQQLLTEALKLCAQGRNQQEERIR